MLFTLLLLVGLVAGMKSIATLGRYLSGHASYEAAIRRAVLEWGVCAASLAVILLLNLH